MLDECYNIETHTGQVVGQLIIGSEALKRGLQEGVVYSLGGKFTRGDRILIGATILPLPASPALPKSSQEQMAEMATAMEKAAAELRSAINRESVEEVCVNCENGVPHKRPDQCRWMNKKDHPNYRDGV